VRERRLPDACHDPSHARHLVGEAPVEHHVSHPRAVLGRHQPQVAEALGFVERAPSNERTRQIKVLLAPGADKGRRIEYRRTYRNKSLEERLAEQLLAVAYLGNERNPLGAHIDTGRTKPLGGRTHRLPVAISVPAESIVKFPGKAPGGVRLWLVAVADDKGARTTVRQQMIAVGDGNDVIEGHYRFEVGMNLPEGSYDVAVGVRDETSGVLSLVRKPVLVPTTD